MKPRKDNTLREMLGLLRWVFFKEIYMSLTKSLHGKQVLGIVLVVVILLVIFAYGIRGYRTSGNYCSFGPKKVCTDTETCKVEDKAEDSIAAPAVR